ncbi:hypothetical protein K457DRAFT_1870374 [Linnemannia elongata AG-77]|uniref:Uncharacterized protein n=1 Tax=Linnemannia elongata AG-77 TaxID=1314771 RepID=A0A197KFW2_9FUNG|nr:hypothetical protein K457DRAFT_1870374 [Linnemannia elongata AG-77]
MSSLRNRTAHPDCNAWQDTRMHCLRVRRVVGRKHQMLRREHYTELLATTASSDNRTMYHHLKLNNDNNNPSSWTTTASSSTYSAGPGPISHRRHNLASERRLFPSQSSEPYSLCERSMSLSGVGAAPHAVGHSTRSYQPSDDAPLLMPLPPFVQRIDMAGSPFSPLSPYDPYATSTDESPHHRSIRSGNPFSGARTHSSGGGGSGGGGGTTTAPADMSPGGGDATEGDTPSDYTFRRRNAIVEGSEDAPKADDFPNNSPK